MYLRSILNSQRPMSGKGTKNLVACLLTLLISLASAATVLAGGFYLSVERPPSSNDPELKEAVLIVRPYGCHRPTDADVSATAEGIINGQRKSLELKLTQTNAGIYAIKQEWPSEGVWVLAITGTYLGHTRGALVELGPNGKVQSEGRVIVAKEKGLPVRYVPRKLTAREIEAELQALTGQVSENSQATDASILSTLGSPAWMAAGLGALFIGFVAFKKRAHMTRH